VPTLTEEFTGESAGTIAGRMAGMWHILEGKGVRREVIVRNSLIAPATCNLLNVDKNETVDRAFGTLREVSHFLSGRIE
jgi:hypothetical protein